ncbi:MAG: hypothetical protein WBA88_01825 [Pseudaminobacter sp.]
MSDYREAFVGIDVAKLRNAIAIADAGREGEVRFFGEVDASATSMRRVIQRIAAKFDRVYFCLYEEGQGGTGVSGQHFFTSSMCCGIHGLSPVA